MAAELPIHGGLPWHRLVLRFLLTADVLHASLERTMIKNDSSSYNLYSSSSLAAVVSPMVHTFTKHDMLIIFMIESRIFVKISLTATLLPHSEISSAWYWLVESGRNMRLSETRPATITAD